MNVVDISSSLPRHKTEKYKIRKLEDIKRVVIHCTNWLTTPQKLAEYDITPYFIVKGVKYWNHISKKGAAAITYHGLVMEDGTCYHTLPWEEISYHVGVWNGSSLGLALMYVCESKDKKVIYKPTDQAMLSLYKRVGGILLNLKLPPTDKHLVGHRELEFTGFKWINLRKSFLKSCPGWGIDMDQVRSKVAKYMQLELRKKELYFGRIDGFFLNKSLAALNALRPKQ